MQRVDSDDRRRLIDELVARVAVACGERPDRMTLVGVDGIDGAGKSTLADELACGIAATGRVAVRASIDSFHRARCERYARGRTSGDGFYLDSHDLDAFRTCLLDPVRSGGAFCTAIFDEPSDSPIERTWVRSVAGGAVVVDGLFLHRPELRDTWDLSIWVDAAERVRQERIARAVAGAPAEGALLLLHLLGWWARLARYVSGVERYVRDRSPTDAATIFVDNNDLNHPQEVVRLIADNTTR
jgi:uridine kinase